VSSRRAVSSGPVTIVETGTATAPISIAARIDAAIAAGGTLVSDAEAPSFWVLADPEGNRVCLCTWRERDVNQADGPDSP